MSFNIVLHEPEIPPNTGNIARTCAATGTKLHLIKPLGFSIDEASVKRAGLDYWKHLDLTVYENIESFFNQNQTGTKYFLTTKSQKVYTEVAFKEGDYLIFGKETAGLPIELLKENWDHSIRIPMIDKESLRSLNLSNAVNIVLFEALRHTGFEGLR